MSWLGRAWARLLPAARRDWAEALWAEADEVPAGWERLAWRAGGVRLIAREARLARKAAVLLLVAAAAWAAWPASAVPLSHGAVNQGDVIITIALLAGLPLLARRLLGPPASRAARLLRWGFCAAIVAIMPAKAVAEQLIGATPRGGIGLRTFDLITQGSPAPGSASGGPDWGGEVIVLLITACYLAVVLALTSRRANLAPVTLAAGAGAGLVLGVVMYAVDPLGGSKYATNPWLHGSAIDPLVILAWAVLLTAPAVAAGLAARRCPVPDDPGAANNARAWQGFAAGLVCTGTGALTAAVLGTGTIALVIKSALVRSWLFHGAHLTASAVYGRELYAATGAAFYCAICVAFPLIGVAVSMVGSAAAIPVPRADGGPSGQPGRERAHDSVVTRLAEPGADADAAPGLPDARDAGAAGGLAGAA